MDIRIETSSVIPYNMHPAIVNSHVGSSLFTSWRIRAYLSFGQPDCAIEVSIEDILVATFRVSPYNVDLPILSGDDRGLLSLI